VDAYFLTKQVRLIEPLTNEVPGTGGNKFPEIEFLDIKLTKDLSLLLHAIHSPFDWF
jgi:hypothetical protein